MGVCVLYRRIRCSRPLGGGACEPDTRSGNSRRCSSSPEQEPAPQLYQMSASQIAATQLHEWVGRKEVLIQYRRLTLDADADKQAGRKQTNKTRVCIQCA